jgi:hypothetical protein
MFAFQVGRGGVSGKQTRRTQTFFGHFSLALLMEASSGGKEITKTSFNLGLVFLFFSSSKKVIRWVVQTEQLGFEVSEKKSFP